MVDFVHADLACSLHSQVSILSVGHESLKIVVCSVGVHVHHEFATLARVSQNTNTLRIKFRKWLLACSKRDDSNLCLVMVVAGNLVGIEGWVVADDSSINLHLGEAVAVGVYFGVEEGGGGRRSSCGIADGHVVDERVLAREVLAEEPWLLAVVVVGHDQNFVGKGLFDPVVSEEGFHDVVETCTGVRRVRQPAGKTGNGGAQDQAEQNEDSENYPLLDFVGFVLNFNSLELVNGLLDLLIGLSLEESLDVKLVGQVFLREVALTGCCQLRASGE